MSTQIIKGTLLCRNYFVFKHELQLLGTRELSLNAKFQISIFDDGTTAWSQKINKDI